jgi:aminopeptidase-like protein
LPRDIVSDGYDQALDILASQVEMTIHEYPTGRECFTWVVPDKWTCREAWLETLDGERLFSYADNPLHVMSYSESVDQVVDRETLLKHLYTHPLLEDAIPFVFSYYKRRWGLACSRRLKEALQNDHYRVRIDSEFTQGSLKVGEVVLPGESEQCFVLCAHLCHPRLVNDGLSGVVAGLQVMQELVRRREKPRYTYRLVILPETIGSAAYLSHNQHLIPLMKGGVFLEMLALPYPHALQRSYQGDSEMDRCAEIILRDLDPESWSDDFLKVILNDERMFNAPGVRCPMVSVSRVRPKGHAEYPHLEYHSDFDCIERADF